MWCVTVWLYLQTRNNVVETLEQNLIRATMREQKEATRLGLQAAQIASNKAALEALVKEKEEEVAKAKADFQEGMWDLSLCSSPTVHRCRCSASPVRGRERGLQGQAADQQS